MKISNVISNLELIAQDPSGITSLRTLFVELALKGGLDHHSSRDENGHPSHWRITPANEILKSQSGNSKLIKGKLHDKHLDGTFPGYSASGQDVWLDHWEHDGTAAILSAVGARCGKAFLAQGKWSAIANTHIIWISEDCFLPEYAMLILNNENFWIRSGTAQPFVKVKATLEKQIAVPPLDEQELILKKVFHFMQKCDQLETACKKRDSVLNATQKSVIDAISTAQTPEDLHFAWERIQNNWEVIAGNKDSVDSIRTLILDLAVMGNLVRMDYLDGTETIEWSTHELKLDDSKLWYLPTLRKEKRQGWNRIPLAKLGSWGSGGTPSSSRKDYYQNGTIPWVVIGDLNNDILTKTEVKITEKALLESSSKLVPKGSILIAMYGASIGKTSIAGIECCTNQAIAHCIVDPNLILKEYFFIVAKSLKRHLIQEGKGAAQPNISQSVLKHLVIDVPPLSEQEKIVATVNVLMELCEKLEFAIHQTKVLTEKFSQSITFFEA